uniref:Reverse transcriptase zinc-binding domain-containing protein n=2 Tax=Aegilops tauschii subsp. strangulata TaxID=200361 RepID=A0A453SUN1_AEGTS
DTARLREIKCKNRRFTWTNERQKPTLVSIDKFFCNVSWELLFPTYGLTASATACSDHCPLILPPCDAPVRRARFRFESFWPKFPHFHTTVEPAWHRPVQQRCAFSRLQTKLNRTARDLKIWSKSLFSDAKLQFHIASEVILCLDVAQERRILSTAEFTLRRQLKLRLVGLAVIERARRRQASRVLWLRAGDASTKFFHAKCCSRRRKNFIHTIQSDDRVATTHSDKAQLIHDHFSKAM